MTDFYYVIKIWLQLSDETALGDLSVTYLGMGEIL